MTDKPDANGRVVIGKVISDAMQKTAVVLVERNIKHVRYGKYIKRSTKLHAHNELGCKVGEKVKLMETKPLSKTKFWKIIERV